MAWRRDDGKAAARGLERALGRFARAEDGVLMIFGVFVVLIMMMAAGLAVDTIRHERERARTQATLDRAVLAAADLQQRLTPEEVVADHFAKAGLSDRLRPDSVVVEEKLNGRSVSAVADYDVPTMLLHMVGVDSLGVATSAGAEERARDVEISLVLDVSSSMRGNRLKKLKQAATQFVDTVMPNATEAGDGGATTITLVPYAASVNVGPDLMDLYAAEPRHRYSNCVTFEDGDFASTALPPAGALVQHAHFEDDYGGYEKNASPRRIKIPLCPRAEGFDGNGQAALLPFETDPVELREAVADLDVIRGTGTDTGMRWGVAMLDPSARPAIDALVARGRVGSLAAGRPLDHGDEHALKVAVLMTDGSPNGQRRFQPALSSGPSNIWWDRNSGKYSVLVRGSHRRCYPYDGAWPRGCTGLGEPDGIARVAPGVLDDDAAPQWLWLKENGDRIEDELKPSPFSRRRDSATERNDWELLDQDLVRLGWPDVFDRFTLNDTVKLHHWLYDEGKLSSAEWAILGHPRLDANSYSQTVKRLQQICDAAKGEGIEVYTVGFELSSEGARRLMRNCATSVEEHYFEVEGVQISEAFATIATRIDQLRLTR